MIIGIGGLGGSGTRVYAEILKSLGYFIGADLNAENDNLLFTRLMKNPDWYKNASPNDIRLRLNWFVQLMSGHKELPMSEILTAIKDNSTFHTNEAYTLLLEAYTKREQWAWKEPNSHIYLKYYSQLIPQLKYILVIRDGLDMALSNNIQQLTNWGELLYNISFDAGDNEAVAHAQLEYWIAANSKAIKDGQLYLGNNFLVCNFDRLCAQPEFEIARILRFVSQKINSKQIKELAKLPQKPSSSGRYLKSGLKFPTDLLTKVHRLNNGQPLKKFL